MTKQRAVILEVIRSSDSHYTAEEIFSLSKDRLPSISRATVYNNLAALIDEGHIRRITGDAGRDRYDKAYTPHAHKVCILCDKTWDFSLDGFDTLLFNTVGADYESYELKVRCVCEDCKKKRNN